MEDAWDELDALIGRAMSNLPDPAPRTAEQEVSSEIRLDYPLPEEDAFATRLTPEPAGEAVPEPDAWQPHARPEGTGAAIPSLGGSFEEEEPDVDPAAAAWQAGIPVSDLLTGRYAAPAASAVGRQGTDAGQEPVQPAGRLRVSAAVGNSASAPISTPPSAARATPEAQALAAAAE